MIQIDNKTSDQFHSIIRIDARNVQVIKAVGKLKQTSYLNRDISFLDFRKRDMVELYSQMLGCPPHPGI